MRLNVCVGCLVGLLAQQARADFVLTGATAQSARTAVPVTASETTMLAPGPDKREAPTLLPAPRFKTAWGFGDQIPLAFACRQIVPPGIRVTYGPGADPKALVSWKGGSAWSHVLSAAVRPLGLHLMITRTAIEIRR